MKQDKPGAVCGLKLKCTFVNTFIANSEALSSACLHIPGCRKLDTFSKTLCSGSSQAWPWFRECDDGTWARWDSTLFVPAETYTSSSLTWPTTSVPKARLDQSASLPHFHNILPASYQCSFYYLKGFCLQSLIKAAWFVHLISWCVQ